MRLLAFPILAGLASAAFDLNRDGLPDELQLGADDANGNGLRDILEHLQGSHVFPLDRNANGVPDSVDVANGIPLVGHFAHDLNRNGVHDSSDVANGVPVFGPPSPHDRNRNGIPDINDLFSGGSGSHRLLLSPSVDADQNGVHDLIQGDSEDEDKARAAKAERLAQLFPSDRNANGVADILESHAARDVNFNDVPDASELAQLHAADADANGIPDGLDMRAKARLSRAQSALSLARARALHPLSIGADLNGNGVADVYERNLLGDLNANGVPDSLEHAGFAPYHHYNPGLPYRYHPFSYHPLHHGLSDLNVNGVPDHLEFPHPLDVNRNGILDSVERAAGIPITSQNDAVLAYQKLKGLLQKGGVESVEAQLLQPHSLLKLFAKHSQDGVVKLATVAPKPTPKPQPPVKKPTVKP
jgi:hypothetical protein